MPAGFAAGRSALLRGKRGDRGRCQYSFDRKTLSDSRGKGHRWGQSFPDRIAGTIPRHMAPLDMGAGQNAVVIPADEKFVRVADGLHNGRTPV